MTVVHHPEFYLANGDLVICSSSGDDVNSTVFRVHKAVFAYNSPVFRVMFALPNNPSAQEMFEGVPLVRVIDSKEELEQLIEALYNPRCVCCSLPGATCTQEHINRLPGFSPFRVGIHIPLRFSKTMKLATKYQFGAVCKRIADALADNWPRTFADWLRFDSEAAALEPKYHYDEQHSAAKRLDDCIPEPASAIRFARDFDVPSILPFAFYTLATIHPDGDWDAKRQNVPDIQQQPDVRSARCGLLRVDDYSQLLRGKDMLARCILDIVERYDNAKAPWDMIDCKRKRQCIAMYELLSNDWRNDVLSGASHLVCTGIPDPLQILEELYASAESDRLLSPLSHGPEKRYSRSAGSRLEEDSWGVRSLRADTMFSGQHAFLYP